MALLYNPMKSHGSMEEDGIYIMGNSKAGIYIKENDQLGLGSETNLINKMENGNKM